jgi:hypothetical protein
MKRRIPEMEYVSWCRIFLYVTSFVYEECNDTASPYPTLPVVTTTDAVLPVTIVPRMDESIVKIRLNLYEEIEIQ